MNEGGPRLDGDDRFMNLPPDVAGNQLQRAFRQADSRLDIDTAFSGIDRQSGEFEFRNGVAPGGRWKCCIALRIGTSLRRRGGHGFLRSIRPDLR